MITERKYKNVEGENTLNRIDNIFDLAYYNDAVGKGSHNIIHLVIILL